MQYSAGRKSRGRPKGWAKVAQEILQETREGKEMVEYALKIWRDPMEPTYRRDAMLHWLADRGLGKAVNIVEMDMQIGAAPSLLDAIDMSKLSDAQLQALKAQLAPALPSVARHFLPEPEDAEIMEVPTEKPEE